MRIETEIKMVEQEIVKYIAEDGLIFESECECKKYEEKQILQELIKQAEKLRMKELDDQIPLSDDGLMNENNTFRWYRLENQKDFKTLNKAYGNQLEEPKNYPEIMCVETDGYEAYLDDAYSYDMTTCKTITENFWEKFGYKVTFEREE